MKLQLLSLLLLGCSLTTAMASSSHPVVAAEKARGQALVNNDAKAVSALLADDLLYTHSNGRRESKNDIVRSFETKSLAYERFDLAELEAREITPDVVVLTGKIDQRKLGSNGKWADAKLLFHAVWRKDAGTWRLASMQTAMPPAAK